MKPSRRAETQLHASYALAVQIMKDRATSFYQAFNLLPAKRFQGVAALYAFCRYADDTVDQIALGRQKDDALEKLDRLEAALQRSYASSASSPPPAELPWWPAFENTIHRFNIPIDSFRNQIHGQRRDADFTDIRSMDDLIAYCKLVAGSVGVMMIPLLAAVEADPTNPDFVQACEHLGVAMQITNILRDVGEDLRARNRVYLPADLLREYAIPRAQLEALALQPSDAPHNLPIPENFKQLWEHLAQQADSFYGKYEQWLSWFYPTCRLPLVAAALLYQAIADAVRSEAYNCFTKRCYTDTLTRARLVLEARRRVSSMIHRFIQDDLQGDVPCMTND